MGQGLPVVVGTAALPSLPRSGGGLCAGYVSACMLVQWGAVAQLRCVGVVCVLLQVSTVSGTPIYGYNKDEREFVRVQLFNPAMTKRVAAALQSGRVLDTRFQPYETHISFMLRVRSPCLHVAVSRRGECAAVR